MEETASKYGGWLRIYLISSSGQPTRDGPPAWGLGVGLTTPHRKKISLLRKIKKPQTWTHGAETWSLTLRDEHRLRIFENRMLRKISGPKRDEVTGNWKNYIMRSFITCTILQI
jgi:hypothetical protein